MWVHRALRLASRAELISAEWLEADSQNSQTQVVQRRWFLLCCVLAASKRQSNLTLLIIWHHLLQYVLHLFNLLNWVNESSTSSYCLCVNRYIHIKYVLAIYYIYIYTIYKLLYIRKSPASCVVYMNCLTRFDVFHTN